MDIDTLADAINQDRRSTLRLTFSDGDTIELPAGVRAFEQGMDTLLVYWPGDEPHKITRSFYLSALAVTRFEAATA